MVATSSMAMPSFADLLQDVAAGDVLKRYLDARAIKTVGAMALLAKDEAHLEQVLIAPLLSGWTSSDGTRISLADAEKPIAEAMLRHIWSEARLAWDRAWQ